jgi:hypothetical protein
MHPRWNSMKLQNDVALIKLPTPVSFTRKLFFFIVSHEYVIN